MILSRKVLFTGVACFSIMGLVTGSKTGQKMDNRIYAGLLGKYVENGLANYHGFKNEEARLDHYLKILEGLIPSSCPPFRSEPYQGVILDQQLDEMVSAFINDPSRNHLEVNALYVSKIFDWFEEDFYGDVLGFIIKYAKGGLKKGMESNKRDIAIKYLDYDWSLNRK